MEHMTTLDKLRILDRQIEEVTSLINSGSYLSYGLDVGLSVGSRNGDGSYDHAFSFSHEGNLDTLMHAVLAQLRWEHARLFARLRRETQTEAMNYLLQREGTGNGGAT